MTLFELSKATFARSDEHVRAHFGKPTTSEPQVFTSPSQTRAILTRTYEHNASGCRLVALIRLSLVQPYNEEAFEMEGEYLLTPSFQLACDVPLEAVDTMNDILSGITAMCQNHNEVTMTKLMQGAK